VRGRRTLERLMALEALGVPISRNRAFEVFSDPRTLPILRYAHYLGRVARLLRRDERLIVRQESDGGVTLIVADRRARYRHTVFLEAAEVAYLVRHDRTLERWLGNPFE
jgi:hypothetical protein